MKKLLLIGALLLSAHFSKAQCTDPMVISGPTVVCLGSIVSYSAYGNPSSNLFWSLNGGGSLNPLSNRVFWTTPGNWQISVFNPSCPTNPSTVLSVTVVNSQAVATPSQITGPISVCTGATSIYSVPAIAGLTPVWHVAPYPAHFTPPGYTPPSLITSGNQVAIEWPTTVASYTLRASYTNGTCSGNQIEIIIYNGSGNSPINISSNESDSFCIGQTFQFVASSGDPLDNFNWTLSGGGTLTTNNNTATVQWTSQGTFTLSVTAVNPCSPTPRTVNKILTVGQGIPTPGIISKQNLITCAGQVERFSIEPVVGAGSYRWIGVTTIGNWEATTTTAYYDRSFTSNTTGTISVVANNSYCSSPSSPPLSFTIGNHPLSLTINNQPFIDPNGSFPPTFTNACLGDVVTIAAASVMNLSGASFSWNVGDGIIHGASTSNTINVQWNSSGVKTITAIANTPCGQISKSNVVRIQSPPQITTITGATQACTGQYLYTASEADLLGLSSITWSLTLQGGGTTNGGTIVPIPTPPFGPTLIIPSTTVIWNTPGNYTLTATAKKLCGSEFSKSVDITVLSGNASAISIQNHTPICPGTTTTSIPYSIISGNPTLYRIDWDDYVNNAGMPDVPATTLTVGQISISGIPNSTSAYSYSGRLFVRDSPSGCENSGHYISVQLSQIPTITLDPIQPVCDGTTSASISYTNITGNTVGYNMEYRIDWDNTSNAAGLSDVAFTTLPASPIAITGLPVAYGTYAGTLFVRNSYSGCESTGVAISINVGVNPSITPAAIPLVCSQTTALILYSGSIGSPNQYRIDWSTFTDVPWTTLPPNTIPISELPTTSGTYTGTLFVRNSAGCESIGKPISITISTKPAITLNTVPAVCSGITSSSIPYSGTTGSPNQYRIDWSSLTDIAWTTLPASPISINGLPTTAGTYTGTLHVRNASGCESTGTSISVTVNPKPSITPASIPAVCSGTTSSTIPYSGATGSPNQYRIDWATLTDVPWTILPASPISISSLPTTAGTYTGSLFVRNTSAGCESNAYPISVTINTKPTVTSLNKSVCSGQSSDLLLTSDIGGTTYSWAIQSMSANVTGVTIGTTGTSNPINHTLTNTSTSPGTVVYRVTPTASGCAGTFKDITVTVNPAPSALITGNATFCPEGSTLLTANPGGSQYTYQWLKDGSIISGATSRYYNASAQGSYKVLVTDINSACAKESPAFNVNISPIPTATITSSGPMHLCANQSVTLYAPTGAGYTYTWFWHQPDIIISTSSSAVVTSPGKYSVLITNANGCSNSATVNVTSTQATIIPSGPLCSGSSVTLSAGTGTGSGLSYTYKWQRYALSWLQVSTSSTYTTSSAGRYRLIVTDSYGCSSTSPELNLSTQSNPTPTISASGDVCGTGYLTLTSSSGQNYLWSNGQTTRTITGYSGGSYRVTVTHTNGCIKASSYYTVPYCNPDPDPCYPYYTNSTDREIIPPCLQAIKEQLTEAVIYPNPANREVNVVLPERTLTPIALNLVDAHGRTVHTNGFATGEQQKTIDTSELAAGLYIIQLNTSQGVVRKKVMVVHER